jgi:hypothetical protein
MRKPATHIRLGDGLQGLFHRGDHRGDCPRLRASHSRFALRPTGLEGIAVWRLGRPGQASCPARRAPRCEPCDCGRRALRPEPAVTWRPRGTPDGTAPPAHEGPLDCPVDAPWRVKPRAASRGAPRRMAPGVVWDMLDHALAGGARPARRSSAKVTPAASTHCHRWTSRAWTVSRNVGRSVWPRSVSRSAAWSAFFSREFPALDGTAHRGRAHPRSLGSPSAVPPLGERRVRVLGHLVGSQRALVLEGARPSPRVGLGPPAARAAPALPQLRDKDATATKAWSDRTLGLAPGCQGWDDTVTQVLRVWSHTRYDARHRPYKQLQPALVPHHDGSDG